MSYNTTINLRALEPEDLDLLYTIENNRSLWWVGSQTAPLSRYQLREYIATNSADIYKDEQIRFVVEEISSDSVPNAVAVLDMFNFSAKHSRAEIGIAVRQEARGRHVAQRAISELIRYCREHLDIHQLVATVPVSNEASLAMLRRLGFIEGGILKDWIKHCSEYEDCAIMQFFFK